MYARKVDGDALEFRHRGWLFDESFLFFDLKTDSLWCQATGVAVIGPMKGKRLQRVPVTHTTWKQWRSLHPETVVLAKPKECIEALRKDSYQDYYARRKTRFGLAICLKDQQKLYPLETLADQPVVNDQMSELDVVVVFHGPSGTALAYERQHEGKTLTFQHVESTSDDLILKDAETGRKWSGLTGMPLESPEGAAGLSRVITTQFALDKWPSHFPKGETFLP